MAGLTPAGGASGQTSQQYGTNVAPISFPGIASGIDYTSIINKLVGITSAQATPLQNQLTQLNNANTELVKINGLLSALQNQLKTLSDPTIISSYAATVSDPTAASASQIAGSIANPGNYVILSATPATATQITGNPAAGKAIDPTQKLQNAGFSTTPSNGSATNGTFTINGKTFSYDVTSTSLNALVTVINAQTASTGVTASYNAATDQFTLDSTGPLTVGAATDIGNLERVLKLDTAPVVPNGTGGFKVTSSGPLGGINQYATLGTSGNAGFAATVTSGTFTVNGVAIQVTVGSDSVKNVIDRINSSTAGVIASYDATSSSIVLTNKNTGAQGIVVSDGSSNFASAAHLIPGGATGAAVTIGKLAVVQYLDPSGATRTAYSSSNDLTNVISGIDVHLNRATTTGFTVSVSQSSASLVSALNGFACAYNAIIDEINTATAPPVVGQRSNTQTGQQQASQLTSGGVLFNNQQVLDLKNRLVQYATNLYGKSTSYNSLASIGLALDNSFQQFTAQSPGATPGANGATPSGSGNQTSVGLQTYQGTSGRFAPLDTTKLQTALSANPAALTAFLQGKNGLSFSLGTYLTSVTGLPTLLANGVAGTVPNTSLISSLQQQNQSNITSLNQRIQLITDQANLQANALRAQFSKSESTIAGLQALQAQLSGGLGIH